MSKIFKFKIPFDHCKSALGWDSEDSKTMLNLARKNDALITLLEEVFLLPEDISRAYADRADEMLNESKEVGRIGNAFLSIRSCLLMLGGLTFFIDYVFGVTPYSDKIPSIPEMKSVISNLLADRKRIQDRLIDLYDLLLDFTITEAEESGSSKSPILRYIER